MSHDGLGLLEECTVARYTFKYLRFSYYICIALFIDKTIVPAMLGEIRGIIDGHVMNRMGEIR